MKLSKLGIWECNLHHHPSFLTAILITMFGFYQVNAQCWLNSYSRGAGEVKKYFFKNLKINI